MKPVWRNLNWDNLKQGWRWILRWFDTDKYSRIIRLTACFLTIRWLVYLVLIYRRDFGSPVSFHFWYLGLEILVISLLLNAGLWLSTFPIASRHWVAVGILMVPTLFLSPFVMPKTLFVEGSIGVIVVTFLALYRLYQNRLR